MRGPNIFLMISHSGMVIPNFMQNSFNSYLTNYISSKLYNLFRHWTIYLIGQLVIEKIPHLMNYIKEDAGTEVQP